jgi:hypothetical protein
MSIKKRLQAEKAEKAEKKEKQAKRRAKLRKLALVVGLARARRKRAAARRAA